MPAASWNAIAKNARDSVHQARNELSTARDWMNSDWPEGAGPVDHDARIEAGRLISEAKVLLDQAKNALDRSAGR
jgi:hypothetical protein